VAPKEDTGVSAAQVTFGIQLTLPGELLGAPLAVVEDLVRGLQEDEAAFTPIPMRSQSYAEVAAELPKTCLGQTTSVFAMATC
jgi:hypothetical protein